MFRSPARPSRASAALAALLLPLACEAPPPPEPEPEPPAGFEAERALEHVRALSKTGPRGPGEPGAADARAYIRQALEEHGIALHAIGSDGDGSAQAESAEEDAADADAAAAEGAPEDAGPPGELRNVVARIPPAEGGSQDVFVLTAPYDSRELEDAGEGVSGAALLLELARVLAERPLPYTVRLAFLQGEAPSGTEERPSFAGSRALVDALEEEEAMARLRLLLYAVDVCRPDIEMIRDLFSSRVYRRRLFQAGRALGYEATFPRDTPFQEAAAGHRIFFQRGFRRGIALSASGELASQQEDQEEQEEPDAPEGEGGSEDAEGSAEPADAEGGEPGEGGGASSARSAESEDAPQAGDEESGAGEGDAAVAEAEAAGPAGCDRRSLAAVGRTADHALRDIADLLRTVDRFSTRPEPEEEAGAEAGDEDEAPATEAADEG